MQFLFPVCSEFEEAAQLLSANPEAVTRSALDLSSAKRERERERVRVNINLSEEEGEDEEAELLSGQKQQPNFWSFDYYQSFFNIDTLQVLDRIKGSLLPLPGKNFVKHHLRNNPDLYGEGECVWNDIPEVMRFLFPVCSEFEEAAQLLSANPEAVTRSALDLSSAKRERERESVRVNVNLSEEEGEDEEAEFEEAAQLLSANPEAVTRSALDLSSAKRERERESVRVNVNLSEEEGEEEEAEVRERERERVRVNVILSVEWILSSVFEWILSSVFEWILSSVFEWILSSVFEWILSSVFEWILSSVFEWILSSVFEWILSSVFEWILSSVFEWILSSVFEWILSSVFEWILSSVFEWILSSVFEWILSSVFECLFLSQLLSGQKKQPNFWSFDYYQSFFNIDTLQILWIIPVDWLRWLLILLAMALSGSVLVLTFWPVIRDDTKPASIATVTAILLLHALLAIGCKILWIIPVDWLRWLLILLAMALSGSVLVLTFWPVIRDDTKPASIATVTAILLLHALLAIGCKVSQATPLHPVCHNAVPVSCTNMKLLNTKPASIATVTAILLLHALLAIGCKVSQATPLHPVCHNAVPVSCTNMKLLKCCDLQCCSLQTPL
ncbi:UNVERIFIED_CONTAM: hypothetical protein FKN15_028859 [Acipenser sinensis]